MSEEAADSIILKADSIILKALAEDLCSETLSGWLWYCDSHDTHGNADSEDEARFIAQAHFHFCSINDCEEPCDLYVLHRRTRARGDVIFE